MGLFLKKLKAESLPHPHVTSCSPALPLATSIQYLLPTQQDLVVSLASKY